MNLFDLSAKLTLDRTEYEQGLKDAKQSGEDFSKKTERQIGIISADAWTNLASKVLDVGKAIVSASLETINYADAIGDMAGKWGFTTREIQEFDYWATMNGTTIESLLTGMRGLVNQAEAGANAFKVLGLNVKDNNGNLKDQRTLFLETLDALQRIPNQTQRNALQFEIFGRAGIELGQVIGKSREELEGLSNEAERLGIILDEQTIEYAGKFNDTLDQIRLQGKSAFASIIAGAEDAEERFNQFTQNLVVLLEELAPQFFEVGEKLGQVLVSAIWERIKKNFEDKLLQSIGKGWLWGFEEETSNPINAIESATNEINSTSNIGYSSENSTYNISVEMSSTNYTKEDAKILAEEVIKEIATKKQASGR